MQSNKHYLAAAEFYGTKRAERSQVPLICHIDEGLLILDAIGGSMRAKEVFCIHPMLQGNGALTCAIESESIFQKWSPDPASVVLAMEYRAVANAYLSHHYQGADDPIGLSALPEVNDMLIADKVQNRKDFEIYHLGTHKNSEALARYFDNWLRRLGISAERYQELAALLALSRQNTTGSTHNHP